MRMDMIGERKAFRLPISAYSAWWIKDQEHLDLLLDCLDRYGSSNIRVIDLFR